LRGEIDEYQQMRDSLKDDCQQSQQKYQQSQQMCDSLKDKYERSSDSIVGQNVEIEKEKDNEVVEEKKEVEIKTRSYRRPK
jgi:hypothetical protein